MRYLLDTNIVSELVSKEPNEKVIEYINNLNQDSVFLSVITIGEYHGFNHWSNLYFKKLTLVTQNEMDFKNLDIKIINPFKVAH